MSEETSIVITAKDRYSEAVKKMAAHTRAFDKDVEALEAELYSLGKNKTQLKVDVKDAKQKLKEAEKQYEATRSAADGLQLEMAQANYDNVKRNLDLVTKAARDTENQIKKTQSASNKSLGEKINSFGKNDGIASTIVATAATQYFAPMLQEAGAAVATSALGSAYGSALTNSISSALSGAVMGSMIAPGIGTAAGAVAGGFAGLVSAASSVYSSKDESFKSYVQEAVENQLSAMDSTLESGSSIAGSREQTKVAMVQRFGDEAAADDFLDQVKTMAVETNYGYDEIVGYSKLLLNTYDADKTLSVLNTLSDATGGLNLGSSDIEMMISGLSRMETTGKATQEYLNYFSERGVDVYAALSDATGWDKSSIAGHVIAGDISGSTAAEAILQYINETFGGLSEKLASTYDAMVDNLADAQANIDAAMGEGYNEARKEGIQAQTDWMEGESGTALSEAYSAIGAWKASLENEKERLEREFVTEAMESDAYQTAIAAGDAAPAGRLIMEAKVQAQNEYNASEGAQLLAESEMELIDSVRTNTATQEAYWNAGYEMGQAYSKGRAAGASGAWVGYDEGDSIVVTGKTFYHRKTADAAGYATGLERVPYDNFPALLHEGERVLTASEARSYAGGGTTVTVSGNTFVVRQDSDIDAIAAALAEKLNQTEMGGVM